jgi:predicted nucleotidyltransferase
MKREDLLKRVKKTVHEVEPDAQIILYGSRSRKDSEAKSDWDFLVLLDGAVTDDRIDRIRHRLYEIEWDTGELISSIIRNREQWNSHPYTSTPFFENVARDGVSL